MDREGVKEAFETVFKLLACSKCDNVENELFTLSCCPVKYCESCVKTVEDKPCEFCNEENTPGSSTKDPFSSELIFHLRDLQQTIIQISQQSQELRECDDEEDMDDENIEPDEESTSNSDNKKSADKKEEYEPKQRSNYNTSPPLFEDSDLEEDFVNELEDLLEQPKTVVNPTPPVKQDDVQTKLQELPISSNIKETVRISTVEEPAPQRSTRMQSRMRMESETTAEENKNKSVKQQKEKTKASTRTQSRKLLKETEVKTRTRTPTPKTTTALQKEKRVGQQKQMSSAGKNVDDENMEVDEDDDFNLPTLTPHVRTLNKPTVYSRRCKRSLSKNNKNNQSLEGSKVFDYEESGDDSFLKSNVSPPPTLTPYRNVEQRTTKRRKITPETIAQESTTTSTTKSISGAGQRKTSRGSVTGEKGEKSSKKGTETPKSHKDEKDDSQEKANRQLSLSPLLAVQQQQPMISPLILGLQKISDSAEGITRRARNSSNASIGSHSPSLASISFSSANSTEKKNAKGETQLHVVCRNGQLEKAKHVVMAGADVNVQDYAGWTPLHEAITGKGNPGIKLELVKFLCEEGMCNTNVPGSGNETALHEAARAGYKDIVAYLLENSASPRIRNSDGKLPRDVAVNQDIIDLLEKYFGDETGEEDPVVLEIQFSKALLYFNYDVPAKTVSSVKQILKLKVSKQLGDNVTHIIFPVVEPGSGKREVESAFSFEYLYGVASGAFMLGSDWIEKSLPQMKIVFPTPYEIQGCDGREFDTNAAKNSRINKEIGNVGLLDGMCFYFYKNASYDNLQKKDLVTLVKLAGGNIINREPIPESIDPLEYPRRFHAENNPKLNFTSHIILFDEKNEPQESKKYYLEHVKTLRTKWLIDSIGNFSFMDPERYV